MGAALWFVIGLSLFAVLYAFLTLGMIALLALPGWMTYLVIVPLLPGIVLLPLWLYRNGSRRNPPAV